MLGSRIVFAHTASDWDRAAVARFFASHQLTGTAVTPAFVLMTIASLVTVMLSTALRARPAGGSDAGRRDGAGQVPSRPRQMRAYWPTGPPGSTHAPTHNWTIGVLIAATTTLPARARNRSGHSRSRMAITLRHCLWLWPAR